MNNEPEILNFVNGIQIEKKNKITSIKHKVKKFKFKFY